MIFHPHHYYNDWLCHIRGRCRCMIFARVRCKWTHLCNKYIIFTVFNMFITKWFELFVPQMNIEGYEPATILVSVFKSSYHHLKPIFSSSPWVSLILECHEIGQCKDNSIVSNGCGSFRAWDFRLWHKFLSIWIYFIPSCTQTL